MKTHERCLASVHALRGRVDHADVQRLFVAVSRYNLVMQQVFIERLHAIGVLEDIKAACGGEVPADVEHYVDQVRASLLRCQTCEFNNELAEESLTACQDIDQAEGS